MLSLEWCSVYRYIVVIRGKLYEILPLRIYSTSSVTVKHFITLTRLLPLHNVSNVLLNLFDMYVQPYYFSFCREV